MRLDITTLLIVTFALTFLVGLLFLFSWRQARESTALLIWGVGHVAGSLASMGLALRGHIPDALSIGAANALMIGAYGLIWAGMRAFAGRRFRPGLTGAGSLLWCLACLIPAFYESVSGRVILASACAALYCAAGAREIWDGRGEPLPSRRPAAILLALYAACYAVRIPATLLAPPSAAVNPLTLGWVTVLCLAAMLFTLASAFVFMALTKERAEHRQRVAASTDALTGTANRRALVAEAEALLRAGRPVALVVFDLDHFKRINDTYGHAVGDTVLIAFCDLARALMPGATLGRLGGEEFACLVAERGAAEPGPAEPDRILAQVERVRRAFGTIAVAELPGLRLAVSAGLARGAGGDFDTLMRRADAALYAAKRAGRDRVSVAAPALAA